MLEPWVNSLPKPVFQFFHGGYLAVQTFFILSGFVLARTYVHVKWDKKSLGRFFTARFARIYPVYFVSLILISPFIIEMLLPSATGKQMMSAFAAGQSAKLLGIYMFVLQGWTGSLAVGWNTPAWSLSCEFFFYLCFPILFAGLRNVRWRGIFVTVAATILLPIVFDHTGVPWNWKPIYHTADFMAGIAAARIYVLLSASPWWRVRGYLLYVPALLAFGWLIVHPHVVDGTAADLNTYLRPLNVAVLTGLALGGNGLARILSTGIGDFLGKASYSMYVLHVPILWWTGRYLVHGKLHLSRPAGALIYLTLVVLAASAVYQWLEAPASTWLRRQGKRLEGV